MDKQLQTSALDFHLSQPSGRLSSWLQAIWSVCVSKEHTAPISKPLYGDAGSGLLFHLAGDIRLGNSVLPQGVIIQPTSKIAERICLSSGAVLAGIRFHPGAAFAWFGRHVEAPALVTASSGLYDSLQPLYSDLKCQLTHQARLDLLYTWANKSIPNETSLPDSLALALQTIAADPAFTSIDMDLPLSHRQIERLFKRWLDISPKQFQRILRVKKTIHHLQTHKSVSLVDIAQLFGFSDQAHMTREFRTLANITPGKLDDMHR